MTPKKPILVTAAMMAALAAMNPYEGRSGTPRERGEVNPARPKGPAGRYKTRKKKGKGKR